MSYTVPFIIFLLAQTSWLLSFILTKTNLMKDPATILIAGVITLSILTVAPYFVFKRYFQRVNLIMCVFSVFAWSCMIDLSISLESDGYIPSLMGFYMREGEPYLLTGHGTAINYWDGIVHFALYLAIITFYANGQSHREIGLYWLGSMLNSMIVLLQGGIAGNFPFKLPILLNVPYAVLPILAGFKYLHDRPPQAKILKFDPIWKRPVDLLFFVYFLAAIGVALFRGMAVLGGNADAMRVYLNTFEPYLRDPTGFPKFQILAYGYFFFVYYLGAAYGLVCPGQHWMTDWALIHAGAAAQAQFSYILGSIHHRTPESFHSPTTGMPGLVFWIINLSLFIVPHLFAWWCHQDVVKFGRTYAVENVALKDHSMRGKIKAVKTAKLT